MTPKKIFLLTFVIVIGSIFMVSCSRGEGVKPEQEMIGKKEVCPVTGETFTITRHTPVVEHDGNTYYFCCPGCDKSFKENPERYIAQSDATAMRSAEPDTLDFGTQAVCPVTGDTFTIAKHTPAVSYNGKLYYFCCPGCDTEFMKEPEKFLHGGNNDHHSNTVPQSSDDIAYWTCSMHPEVRSDTEGNCPICGMALIPKHELSGSSNSLLLNDTEIELAGIRVEPARKQSVIRIIELVGSVAYDPELVIAQEEYLTARSMLSALDGADKVTLGRTQQVIDKARYKLRLLGMD
ncbi:MAG: YHS domain-containing protein, partial [candidate division WOR-3 bacterium]